jgi:hypothetical protein
MKLSVYIDPFGCNDSRWKIAEFSDPATADLIKNIEYFLGVGTLITEEQFNRFKRLCIEEASLTIVPTGALLFENIFHPLRLAKKSYITGDYLSTIALCGMVGEMLALFIFKIGTTPPNGVGIPEDEQKSKWGSRFERLGQEKRIDALHGLNFIGNEMAQKFDFLRSARRPYFHFWEKKSNNIELDSHEMYLKAISLVAAVFDLRSEPPMLKVHNSVLRFLEQSGEIFPTDVNSEKQ